MGVAEQPYTDAPLQVNVRNVHNVRNVRAVEAAGTNSDVPPLLDAAWDELALREVLP